VHLDDLQVIKTQKTPPLRLLKPIYSPKSLGDMNNSNSKSISPCAEEAKKRSFDLNLDILKKGTDKENLEPSPGRANTPVLKVTATSPSVSPCFSSVSSRSPLSTPSSTSSSSSSSSDSASLTPVMSASARRRLKPSPIISEAVDGRFSPYALSPLYGTASVEGPCRVPARRVTLSPTTTRMMMLEVLADEAATATTPRAVTATAATAAAARENERERERAAGRSVTETQTSSRGRTSMSSTVSNTSSISSTSLVRSPVFSPSNPFGRGAKGAFMTPARPARSASLPSYSPTPASPNHGHSSRELRKTCSMSASDSVDDQATTIRNPGTHTVGTYRSTANCVADSDGDYTPDIITGLPDMQFVRDRNPDKGKDEYLFKNCKGVTEKVSVLLKLFETHMDDVSLESDLCSSVTTVSDMDCSHVEIRFKELSVDTAKESSSLCKDSDVTSNEGVSKCIAGAVHTKVLGVTVCPRAPSTIPRTRDRTTVDPVSLVSAAVSDVERECHDNSCTETFQSVANEEKRFTPGKRMFYATPVREHSLNAILGDRLIPQNKAAATLYEELCQDPICLAGVSPLSEPPSPSRESVPRILTYAHASSVSGAPSSLSPAFVTALATVPVPVPVPVFMSGPSNMLPKRDRYLTPPPKTVMDTDAGPNSVFVLRSDVDGLTEILCPCTTLTEDTTLLKSSSSLPVSSPLLSASTRGNYRCESNSKNGIIRSHKYSVTDAETAQDAEDKAAKRLNIRCQIAHWKYQWELVSYEAAKVARLLAD
jgi:hypothetical protein